MWTAIGVTLLIFAILYSGIFALKRSADKFKIPKDIKPQPYSEDELDDELQPPKQSVEKNND